MNENTLHLDSVAYISSAVILFSMKDLKTFNSFSYNWVQISSEIRLNTGDWKWSQFNVATKIINYNKSFVHEC